MDFENTQTLFNISCVVTIQWECPNYEGIWNLENGGKDFLPDKFYDYDCDYDYDYDYDWLCLWLWLWLWLRLWLLRYKLILIF